jgi:hypothetical protein
MSVLLKWFVKTLLDIHFEKASRPNQELSFERSGEQGVRELQTDVRVRRVPMLVRWVGNYRTADGLDCGAI